jgi:pyridoxal 5'-phosphate synthase pdxT subunit
MASKKIAILALQGAFAKHAEMVQRIGAKAVLVRDSRELATCDGLIIPGGESTTMMRQLKNADLLTAIKTFSEHKPVFGTCAGMILMAKEVVCKTVSPFKMLDITVERNAYGRQAESFITYLDVTTEKKKKRVKTIFIRAPRVKSVGSDVKVLATHNRTPVFVQQGRFFACSFHPELTDETFCHQYFLQEVLK